MKLLKLGSVTVGSGVVATAWYYYFVDRDGYHYKRSVWKRVSDEVQGLIDRRSTLFDCKVYRDQFDYRAVLGAQGTQMVPVDHRDLVVRPPAETMKDLWNREIRTIVSWVYK
ncbi:Mic12p RNJ42_01719 [Nakaseomyces bracarensis]|uniref:Mic12p n=1 Tax=Nakaseomyces bracarensis TaxID=273131 RepID=UPI0038723C4F